MKALLYPFYAYEQPQEVLIEYALQVAIQFTKNIGNQVLAHERSASSKRYHIRFHIPSPPYTSKGDKMCRVFT